ncbi:MAG: hypothetical protein OHK0046_47380 [Anaerolineae bacterium]
MTMIVTIFAKENKVVVQDEGNPHEAPRTQEFTHLPEQAMRDLIFLAYRSTESKQRTVIDINTTAYEIHDHTKALAVWGLLLLATMTVQKAV